MIPPPGTQQLLPQRRKVASVIRSGGERLDQQTRRRVDVVGGVVELEETADQFRLVPRAARRIGEEAGGLVVLLSRAQHVDQCVKNRAILRALLAQAVELARDGIVAAGLAEDFLEQVQRLRAGAELADEIRGAA